jgi:hypothetical protein
MNLVTGLGLGFGTTALGCVCYSIRFVSGTKEFVGTLRQNKNDVLLVTITN